MGSNVSSANAAAIGSLFAIVVVASALWYYVFRYKHANEMEDEDTVEIGESTAEGQTVVVRRPKAKAAGSARVSGGGGIGGIGGVGSGSGSHRGDVSQLLFPEVSNPMLPDVENHTDGNAMALDSPGAGGGAGDDEEETVQIIHIEGIVKMGYLRKMSTGKRWLRRCFFIKDGKLFYVHRHTELIGKQSATARQVANLLVSTVKEVTDVDFQIISPGQRSASAAGGAYQLQGENPVEAREWLRVIRQQIEGALTQSLPATDGSDDYGPPTAGTSSSSSSTVGGISFSTSTGIDSNHSVNGAHHLHLSAATKFVPGRQTIAELRERNPYCADCGAADPEWASLNLCIMMCIDCSGIHRKLGTHVSKVRSVTLDKWAYNNLQLILAVGNDQSNEVWEATMAQTAFADGDGKPSAVSSMEERERFIVRKYVDRAFVFGAEATPDQKEDYLVRCAAAGDLVGVIRAVAAGALRPLHEYTMRPRKTAMHMACLGNHALCVELLCQTNNVLATLADEDGRTPMDLAREGGLADIEEILTAAVGGR